MTFSLKSTRFLKIGSCFKRYSSSIPLGLNSLTDMPASLPLMLAWDTIVVIAYGLMRTALGKGFADVDMEV
jgi:hypothetical protein